MPNSQPLKANYAAWKDAHDDTIRRYQAAWDAWAVTVEHLEEGPEAEAANVQWDAWSAGLTTLWDMPLGQAYRISTPYGTLIQQAATDY